jgi:hypothetical protein
LTPPEYGGELDYVLESFWTLSNQRGSGMDGPAPITLEAIGYANTLGGWGLTSREFNAILRLDYVYRHVDHYAAEWEIVNG